MSTPTDVRSVLGDITVTGNATADEVAAVVAALVQRAGARSRPAEPSGYEQWRRRRLAALRGVAH